MKIKELLKSKRCWCQDHLAVNGKGEPVLDSDHEARRWCLLGAVYKCYGTKKGFMGRKAQSIFRKLMKAVNKIDKSWGSDIAGWNDGSNFSDVKKLVEELDV
jgi:hypothetical protein